MMNQQGPPVEYFAAVLQTKKDRLQHLEAAAAQQATNDWMQRTEIVVLQQLIRHFERVVSEKQEDSASEARFF